MAPPEMWDQDFQAREVASGYSFHAEPARREDDAKDSAQSVAECYWRLVTVSFSPTRDHSSTRPVLHVNSFATNP